ncbi:MORN repeat-containing protein [Chitinimonas taiwanensis]|uniref:MORN repeat-containing protein n=1 Tax=Chitinimonas taiwanensis TaxID=240412 RepID=UPI0035AF5BC8
MKPLCFFAAIIITTATQVHANCKVLDPELQGHYSGDCSSAGFAEGFGEASSSDSSYKGYFKNGKKHGQGVKTWHKTGDQYRGEFHDDYRQGWGIYTWGTQSPWAGQSHEGEYLKDQREGFGVYFWPNGDKFSGQWKAGLRHGESYMEIRKRKAAALAMASATPNQTYCAMRKEGIASRRLIAAKLIHVTDQQIMLALEEPGVNTHSKTVTRELLNPDWQPCQVSSKYEQSIKPD